MQYFRFELSSWMKKAFSFDGNCSSVTRMWCFLFFGIFLVDMNAEEELLAIVKAVETKELLVYHQKFVEIAKEVEKLEREFPKGEGKWATDFKRVAHNDLVENLGVSNLIVLWKRGEGQFVMRRWWESKDPLVRITVGLLLFSQPVSSEVIDGKFSKYVEFSKRFGKAEKVQRLKELVIARKLVSGLSKGKNEIDQIVGKWEKRRWYPY